MKSYFQIIAGMTILTSLAGTAQASLLDRGNGMIYDDVLNITWMQDANLAATEQFGITTLNEGEGRYSSRGYGISMFSKNKGSMTWNTANDWIASMNASNGGKGYKSYNDWRIWGATNAAISCYGPNCSDSELGHLFYSDLGGQYGSSLPETNLPDLALFNNIQDSKYWSGDSYDLWSGGVAWAFWTEDGVQIRTNKTEQYYVWAVRAGDVTDITPTGVAPVPVPAALWLFGSSLLGLATCQRRRIS